MSLPVHKQLSEMKPDVNSEIFNEKNTKEIKNLFQSRSGYVQVKAIEAATNPFIHCIVKNFVCEKDGKPFVKFVDELRINLLKMKFHSKSNDLYKFSQTKELMVNSNNSTLKSSSHHLRSFCSLLQNSMLPWLRDVTGVPLNDDIDMFSAQYNSTDCLLCHDDELEGRCFAYVYYLSPDWTAKDGGTLDLFNSKSSFNKTEIFDPTTITKSIVPSYNSFVFFEVSPQSFHQVSEILSATKTRLSLSGWFHGPTIPRPSRPISVRPETTRFTPADEETNLLSHWINSDYLSFSTQATVQEQFVDNSEIQLNQFLLDEKLDEIQRSFALLNSHNDWWELCGPANKCRYHKLKLSEDYEHELSESTSDVIKSAIESVNAMIGLSFHPMAGNSDSDDDDDEPRSKRCKNKEPGLDSGCRYQLRKWCAGSYTLIRDTDDEQNEYALDLNLFFAPQGDWLEEYGGYTSYIANGEAEELLTIVPSNNCLSITYRDKEAIRFVKYINHTSLAHFYDLSLVYYE